MHKTKAINMIYETFVFFLLMWVSGPACARTSTNLMDPKLTTMKTSSGPEVYKTRTGDL